MSLKVKIVLHLTLALILIFGILFIPAGSFRFWQGWVFLVLVFVTVSSAYIYFYKHDRQLIERRLQSREKVRTQRVLVALLRPAFLAASLLPGLDYRFGWSRRTLGAPPPWLVLFSDAMILGGLSLAMWVLKVNSFASRTIQVESGQKVISTGAYLGSPSHVFGKRGDLAFHALGAGFLHCSACFRDARAFLRLAPAQRGKGPAPGTAGIFRVLPPHPLPARTIRLVKLARSCTSFGVRSTQKKMAPLLGPKLKRQNGRCQDRRCEGPFRQPERHIVKWAQLKRVKDIAL